MAAVALAAHIEQFGGSGYKRDFSQVTQVGAPSVRGGNALTVPNVTIGGSGAIPATSARPDQRVNARVPVARACGQPLTVGQVAFVSRGVGFKRAAGGAEVAPAFAGTHALSLEHLNELLSDPVHYVEGVNATGLFKSVRPRSLYGPNGRTRLSGVSVFNAEDIFKGKHANHPLKQYALDGVVCTPSDDAGDDYGAPIGSSVGVCNVAVKGPAPVLTHRTLHDKMRAVVVAPLPQTRIIPDGFFLQPIDILAKVYVVLVAELVEDAPTNKWKFKYEIVSSSNVNSVHSYKRFTDTVLELKTGGPTKKKIKETRRIVLKVYELGRVVDTNFGSQRNPSIVVSVNIKLLEATRRVLLDGPDGKGGTIKVSLVAPLHVYNTFLTRLERLGGFAHQLAARAPTTPVVRTPVTKGLFSPGAGGIAGLLDTGDAAVKLNEILKSLADMREENAKQATQIIDLVKKSSEDKRVHQIADEQVQEIAEAAALASRAASRAASETPKVPLPLINQEFADVVDELSQVMLAFLVREFGPPDDGVEDDEELEAYLEDQKTAIKNVSGTNVSADAARGAYQVATERTIFAYNYAGKAKSELEDAIRTIFDNKEPKAQEAALEKLAYLRPPQAVAAEI